MKPLGSPQVSLQQTLKSAKAPAKRSVPSTPGPADSVVSSEITDVPFDGFLKYKNFDVSVAQDGSVKKFSGGFVHGPGHHIAAVAAFCFDDAMTPHPILKTGDTRLARAEREQPYVLDGFVAGRMDKKGAESSKIALAELAEEVGGEVVGDTFRKLGQGVTPTMPFESTEGDNYYVAAVEITGDPYGDGGGMEATDLIGPKISTPQEAIRSMDSGEVSEASRTRTLFGRGFDSIGYIPQLNAYVHDHPKLSSKFDTLGLGEAVDVRGGLKASQFPEQKPPAQTLEAQINDVVLTKREENTIAGDSRMINATTKHAVNKNGVVTALEGEFPNQYLQLDYDRAKLVSYYVDSEKGPMVSMKTQARPALAFAPDSPEVLRKDVSDFEVSRDKSVSEQMPDGARKLGEPSGASAGQTDLYYHFWAQEVEAPTQKEGSGFVSLSEAITLCRTGHGDAQTENLCERLADDLDWIPNLDMSVSQAKRLLNK